MSALFRILHLAWLRYCLRCLDDEREGYLAAGVPLGPQYQRNSAAMSRDLRGRIAVLESGINFNRRSIR